MPRLVGAAAIGAVAVALAIPVPAAAAGRGRVQTYYVATTSASAVAFQLTQKPAASIVTADLVDDSLGYTATAFDSSQGSEAQAASIYPGSLVVQGPGLLCNEGVLPFACPVQPPAYPLLADATYPQHPHASAGPSDVTGDKAGTKKGPFTAQAGHATAAADLRGASGDTAGGSAGLLAHTPGAVSVGAQSSHTTVTTAGSSGLTVRVVSHASNISVGPLLHIGSVTGTVVQHLVPGNKPVDRPTVTIADVTVAGQSATIGAHGLKVAGRHGPQVLRRLAAHDIKVSPVTVNRKDSRHGARSSVTGLVITTSLPVKNTPYVPNPVSSVPPFDQLPVGGVDLNGTYLARLQFGAAGSAAAIQRQADVGLGSLGPHPVQPVGHLPGSHPSTTRTVTTPGSAGAPADGVGSQPQQGSPPRVAAAPPKAHGFLDAFTLDLSHFYLVLALGSAALFIAWRGRVLTRGRHLWLRRRA